MEEESDNQGYVEAMERQIEELEAFIHKKGLDEELDEWRDDPESMEADIKEYEKHVYDESGDINMEDI